MSRSVVFGCPTCGRAVEVELPGTTLCPHCGAATPAVANPDVLGACLACGGPDLYRHRDFNQKLGLLLIAGGAGLCIALTSFLPLVAAAVLDGLLYLTLPDVAICYACKAHHRGFADLKRIPRFDLERFESHRIKRARERESGAGARPRK